MERNDLKSALSQFLIHIEMLISCMLRKKQSTYKAKYDYQLLYQGIFINQLNFCYIKDVLCPMFATLKFVSTWKWLTIDGI